MVEVYCGDCRDLVPGLGLFDFIFVFVGLTVVVLWLQSWRWE